MESPVRSDHVVDKRGHVVEKRGHVVEKRGHVVEKRGHMVKKYSHMVESQCSDVVEKRGRGRPRTKPVCTTKLESRGHSLPDPCSMNSNSADVLSKAFGPQTNDFELSLKMMSRMNATSISTNASESIKMKMGPLYTKKPLPRKPSTLSIPAEQPAKLTAATSSKAQPPPIPSTQVAPPSSTTQMLCRPGLPTMKMIIRQVTHWTPLSACNYINI